MTLALAGATAVACGGFGYREITLIDPAPRDDSTIVAGSLRLRVHVAGERVDVRLENTGADTILIDWASARLTISPTPDDEIVHRVARPVTFAMAMTTTTTNRQRAFPFVTPVVSVISPITHQESVELPADREPFPVPPRAVRDESLYPAEHVRVESDGRFVVGPLVCRQSSRFSPRLLVSFPALIDGRWRTIAVEGVLR